MLACGAVAIAPTARHRLRSDLPAEGGAIDLFANIPAIDPAFGTTVLLVIVSVIGGIMSSLLGGAALVTFPALLMLGLSPTAAAIVNTVALLPVSLAATYYERSQLPKIDATVLKLIVTSAAGATLGAALLLATPGRVFEALVPLLLGAATVLFACSRQVSAWIEGGSKPAGDGMHWGKTARALFPTGMYGGYFGVGVGVLVLGVLSVGTRGDYRTANALKNLVLAANILMSTVVYATRDAIAWKPVLIMVIGGICGAWIGTRIARIAPRELMRRAVIAMAAVLTMVYAARYWLHWI